MSTKKIDANGRLPLDGLFMRVTTRDDRWLNAPRNWASAGICDAMAFRVGNSATVHAPRSARPNLVVGWCGVNAAVVERDSRLATWADSVITCTNCIRRQREREGRK